MDMDFTDFIESAVASVTGITVVGGAGVWIFREKVGAWIDARSSGKLGDLDKRVEALEEDMGEVKHDAARTGEAVERFSTTLTDGLTGVKELIERFADRQQKTAESVARIEGSLERKAPPRG